MWQGKMLKAVRTRCHNHQPGKEWGEMILTHPTGVPAQHHELPQQGQ